MTSLATPANLYIGTLYEGKPARISWDPVENATGYILERQFNGTFEQQQLSSSEIYRGPGEAEQGFTWTELDDANLTWSQIEAQNQTWEQHDQLLFRRNTTDTIAIGSQTAIYRIKAYDETGLESAYLTGSQIPVIPININTVAAGLNYSMLLKSDGTVWTWGDNGSGQLGNGTTKNSLSPAKLADLSDITAIAAGGYHSMALQNDGTVWAWGANYYGQLGDGSTTDRLSPVQLPGLSGVTMVAVGSNYSNYSMVLKNDGTVWTWGYNGYGQLGDGSTVNRLLPVQVESLSNITAIAAGSDHSLALKNEGTVWVWGYNSSSQLGDGSTTNRLIPVQVPGLSGVIMISAGNYYSMALKSDGTIWVWGSGQLGNGTYANYSSPVQLQEFSGVIAISAGNNRSMALKSDGTVWIWGDNYYGRPYSKENPDEYIYLTPVQVEGLSDIIAIAAGSNHNLALKNDGTIWTWGENGSGQLGDGTEIPCYSPVCIGTGIPDINPYTISYDANGGAGAPAAQTKTYGAALTISSAVPTRTNYAFMGWATTANATAAAYDPGGTFTGNANTTLYAVWNLVYTVTYDANGGSDAPAAQTTYNKALMLSYAIPTKTGYAFIGWATTADANTPEYDAGGTFTAHVNTTLYAVWRIAYTITYDANGGVGGPYTQVKADGVDLTLYYAVTSRAGYAFMGWALTPDATEPIYNAGGIFTANVDTTLYAVWHASYTIWYNANGGTGGPTTQTKLAGIDLTLTTFIPTRAGATFMGWAATSNAAAAAYSAGGTYTADASTSLYAVWAYTITYDANGGSGAPAAQTKINGQTLTLSSDVPTRTDYVFMGWATTANATVAAYDVGGTFGGNASTTLYAVWGALYSITYNANGGAGAPVAQTKVEGVALTLSSVIPTRAGYIFMGWATLPGATVAMYSAEGTFTINANSTLYAVWNNSTLDIAAIAAGGSNSMLLKTDATVWTWGNNATGQLGNSTTAINRSSWPVTVNLSGITAVSCGAVHNLALKSNGTVWAWGSNTYGQLGNGTTANSSFVQTSGLSGISAVSAGSYYSIALKNDGTVWAFGLNHVGQLGDGTTILNRSLPLQVPNLGSMIAIAAGYGHSMALKSDGTVWTWGYNDNGQLGDGSKTTRTLPVQVLNLSAIIAIVAGGSHSMALQSDGTVWTWGANSNGQLGDGSTTNRFLPIKVPSLTNVVAISAGSNHNMALKNDGTVWVWGYNNYGQLGNGTVTNRTTPVQVANVSGVIAIAAGTYHSLALQIDGTLWSWGYNASGQLGDGTSENRLLPVNTGIGTVKKVTTYTIAYHANGGANAPATQTKIEGIVLNLTSDLPTRTGCKFMGWATTANATIPTYSAGGTFSVNADTTLYAVWSYTITYDANGGTDAPDAQIKVVGETLTLSTVVPTKTGCLFMGWTTTANAVSPEYSVGETCTVNGNTTLYAVWGYTITYNANGGTGAPTAQTKADGAALTLSSVIPARTDYAFMGWATTANAAAPTYSAGGIFTVNAHTTLYAVWNVVVAVSAGGMHSMALKRDGTVWAWGNNGNGQLGIVDVSNKRLSPVEAYNYNLSNTIAIATGYYHSMALKSDGTVWTFGLNNNGQLGDGTTMSGRLPLQVANLTGITAIAAGYCHNMALKSDGTVWTWGDNKYSQLGIGEDYPTTPNSNLPVQVNNLSGIIAIASGYYHCLALKNDGTVWTWGYNGFGALGIGNDSSTTPNSNLPVQAKNLSGITAIAAGQYHCLALKNDGTLWAWGSNNEGQLGGIKPAPPSNFSAQPGQVQNFSGVIAIAAGGLSSMALKNDGTIWGWGSNSYYQINDGANSILKQPVQMQQLSDIAAISIGVSHVVALKNDGTVWAWGANTLGQIGDGTTADKSLPVCIIVGGAATYTISYDANGGTGAPNAQSKADDVDLDLSLIAPMRTGYTFIGWATSANATVPEYNIGWRFTTNANTTLYAVWGNTITYNANGGVGAPAAQIKSVGEALTLISVIPTRSGYVFMGWATTGDPTIPVYSAGGTFTANANTTLYAVWDAVNTTYLWGNELINSKQNENNVYYTYNGHGDVTALTDQAGAVTRMYQYDAFGVQKNQDSADTNPFRYTGQYIDLETKTYYLRARNFEPTTGRFLTEDPAKDGLNWYAYCGNDPVNRWDPSGKSFLGAVIGAVVGAVAGAVLGSGSKSSTYSGSSSSTSALAAVAGATMGALFGMTLGPMAGASVGATIGADVYSAGLRPNPVVLAYVPNPMQLASMGSSAPKAPVNLLFFNPFIDFGRVVTIPAGANKNKWYALEGQSDINYWARKSMKDAGMNVTVQTLTGGVLVDQDGRYWVAVGPNVMNPNHSNNQKVQLEDMEYGTKIDVVLKDSMGLTFYLPAVVGDAKVDTYPTGIVQTGKHIPNGTLTSASNNDGSVIEFIGNLPNGLSNYSIDKIIVYDNYN